MSGFSCPTCTTDNSRQDRQGVRTASQLEQKYNGVIEGLDLKVEGLSKQSAQITMDVGGLKASVNGLAGSQANLELSVNGVSADVTSLTGSVNSLALSVNGFTITDDDGTTRIKGSHIDTSTIAAKSITADKLVLSNSITFADLASGLQSTINSASSNASSALSVANSANTKVSAWTYTGSTYIDGAKIMTGTVAASILSGGMVDILDYYGSTQGYIYAGQNDAGAFALELAGTKGLRLISNGNVYIQGGGTSHITVEPYSVAIGPNAMLSDGTQITSDRNKKEDISYDMSAYEAVFDALRPVTYKLKEGTSGRRHGGFIAQDLEQAILGAGLTTKEYAAYCAIPVYEKDSNGNNTDVIIDYTYAIRYDEIIPINTYEIQKLKKRVAELEARIA